MKTVLELNHTEARIFFLKAESYANVALPQYFDFQTLITEVSNYLIGKNLYGICGTITNDAGEQRPAKPFDFEEVNYTLLNNKDGKFAWRPIQLIHPAIYVSLVHRITEEENWNNIKQKFSEFSSNPNIRCYSIPLEATEEAELSDTASTINNWWHSIEQQSIALSLKYDYVVHTDITDCYGSIYTHSIPWALHTKAIAKQGNVRNNDSYIGVCIDKHLRDMAFGQTNGIPQGSILSDFIAEMVLGYADLELSTKIQNAGINDFEIIRYRDDYRIFVDNPQDGEQVTKLLTEVLIDLGMRLNSQKTIASKNIVRDSIKPDKLHWITSKNSTRKLNEQILLIHSLAEKYPNTGSVRKALTKFAKRANKLEKLSQPEVMIGILVDIMFNNPTTYPIASAILSKFLSLMDNSDLINDVLSLIDKKFKKIPNTGHVQIWLQRITIKINRNRDYGEKLCKRVNDSSIEIWNSSWLNNAMKAIIADSPIINEQKIEEINQIIDLKEVDVFHYDS